MDYSQPCLFTSHRNGFIFAVSMGTVLSDTIQCLHEPSPPTPVLFVVQQKTPSYKSTEGV